MIKQKIFSEFTAEIHPYIEMAEEYHVTSANPKIPQKGCSAYVGFRVFPKSFDAIVENKWGFNSKAFLEEIQNRQIGFLNLLRFREGDMLEADSVTRSISLRYIYDPVGGELQIALVGKVWANGELLVHRSACELARQIKALLPYDYQCVSLKSREELYKFTGKRLLDSAQCTGDIVELRRSEDLIQTNVSNAYILSSWNVPALESENIWRALASSDKPIMLAITIRPTQLTLEEECILSELVEGSKRTADLIEYPILKMKAARAADSLNERIKSWQSPYLLQLHLAAVQGVPDYITRAVGSALETRLDLEASIEPYRIIKPNHPRAVRKSNRLLRTLSFESHPSQMQNNFIARFPYLFSLEEAQSIFRLPTVPKGGIEGLNFGNFPHSNEGMRRLPLGI